MKRKTSVKGILVALILITLCLGNIYAQSGASVYVSATGIDTNNGRSEDKPFRTFAKAFKTAVDNKINTITVIGTLNLATEQTPGRDALFELECKDNSRVITITGREDGRRSDKAILSGKGSKLPVVGVFGGKYIFRNIEISGTEYTYIYNTDWYTGKDPGLYIEFGEVELSDGVVITDNYKGIVCSGSLSIYNGAKVNNNKDNGVTIMENGKLLLSGGLIHNNYKKGVSVMNNSSFTMAGGTISKNYGGGVYISNSYFELRAGTIEGNRTGYGGGVCVVAHGSFLMIGGLIEKNSAFHGSGVMYSSNSNFTQRGGTIRNNNENGSDSDYDYRFEGIDKGPTWTGWDG